MTYNTHKTFFATTVGPPFTCSVYTIHLLHVNTNSCTFSVCTEKCYGLHCYKCRDQHSKYLHGDVEFLLEMFGWPTPPEQQYQMILMNRIQQKVTLQVY